MALTVVSDPLDPTSNSYATVAQVTEYATDRIVDGSVATAWEALTESQQAAYVVNATRSIDDATEWIGDKYDGEQLLDWPRRNAWADGWLVDSTIYPIKVVEATCEMALWLMTNAGVTPVSSGALFDSIKVGPIVIDYNEASGEPAQRHFPDVVAYLLADYGSLNAPNIPGNNTAKTVRLYRA